MKKTKDGAFVFYCVSSFGDVIERIKKNADQSNFKFEHIQNDFDLQIDSNHGGRILYRARVTTDENGGSVINGKIVTVPWNDKPNKRKNLLQKMITVLGIIVILPLILLCLICVGMYILFVRLFHGKNKESTVQEKLCDFMINKVGCTHGMSQTYGEKC
ncbi:MAG: hypothetical protein IJW55_05170 [Clostridia bacterium]|nr:hypothetical protein [Clostridia bacterium]